MVLVQILFELLVAFLTLYAARFYGIKTTFYWFSIPVMVMVPFLFTWQITPGIPPLTFFFASLLPLLVVAFWEHPVRFRLGIADGLVIAYSLLSFATAAVAVDIKSGLLSLQDQVLYTLGPWFLVRLLVARVETLRFLVVLSLFITVVALLAPLEFLFNFKLVNFLQAVWPEYVLGAPFRRGGFYRVFGTFGHPIHMGMGFSLAFYVGFLALKLRVFKTNRLPWIIMILNGFGIWMTVSRTAWLLLVPMLLFVYFPFVKRKILYSVSLLSALVLVLAIALPAWNDYINSTADYSTLDETQTSAMYRAVLMENYQRVVWSNPWIGFGIHFPVINGQSSIDNQFLFLALVSGVVVTGVYMAIMAWLALRGGLRYADRSRPFKEQAVTWFLTGVVLFYVVMGTAVYFNFQVVVIQWMLFAALVNQYSPAKSEVRPLIRFKRPL